MNEKMAVYRVHDSSYWSSKKQEERTLIWIDFLQNIKKYFQLEIQLLFEEQIFKLSNTETCVKKLSITKKIKLRIKKFLKIN